MLIVYSVIGVLVALLSIDNGDGLFRSAVNGLLWPMLLVMALLGPAVRLALMVLSRASDFSEQRPLVSLVAVMASVILLLSATA